MNRVRSAARSKCTGPEGRLEARPPPRFSTIPDPSGALQEFAIYDSPVMDAALAAKYPDVHTYKGVGIDDLTADIRADLLLPASTLPCVRAAVPGISTLSTTSTRAFTRHTWAQPSRTRMASHRTSTDAQGLALKDTDQSSAARVAT